MNGPLQRVYVDSEVEELRSVILHAPGDAHRNILPEHVEAVLSLQDYLYRSARVGEEEVASLRLECAGDPGHGIDLKKVQGLRLRFTTHDGHEATVGLPGQLEQLFVENPQYILFDDIVDAEDIQTEYARFERVIRTVAPHTMQLSALLHDAVHQVQLDQALEEEFFTRLERFSPPEERANVRASRRYLHRQGPRAFLKLLMTGRDNYGRYVFHPLPNLLFTRDLTAAVGDALVVCSAAKPTRLREMALAWLIFHAHPLFAQMQSSGKARVVDMLHAASQHERPERVTIEGGDILHLGGGTLLVGIGERTTREGAIEMARLLWQEGRSSIERVIAVDILARRASMHLDTIFTMVHQDGDEFEAMVYGPYVQEAGYGDITAIVIEPHHFKNNKRPGPDDFTEVRHRSLSQMFSEVQGWRMRTLFCGGRPERPPRGPENDWSQVDDVFFGALPEQLSSKREQWTDGANLFALAPGIVTTYARNHGSLDELAAHGFQVVLPDDFVRNSLYYLKRCRGANAQRVVIPLGGSELSRGRGGQRCMTLPLLRQRTSRTG